MSTAVIDPIGEVILSFDGLEKHILDHVGKENLSLDRLIEMLPQYSWNQVFHAVDRLARRGNITLGRHGFEYTIARAQHASGRRCSADSRL
jgi:hypothetical protein